MFKICHSILPGQKTSTGLAPMLITLAGLDRSSRP
ncbi:hypothetical protein MESS2_1420011 [Mesorhizobium metallidurans STM 2683]|uniref:Uncharacterized protein n=1 Tax=Mesorhizobium metallidurans STM 2683 TaxID=1297569 RepID=M5EKM1_9HYPH|nr:hypothetical protein MESS2_1420011 [Mesorhizobium metallidurans STM 2683]